MTDPSRDPSVFDEPHMSGGRFRPDPEDPPMRPDDRRPDADETGLDERVEHGVWDEPTYSAELSGAAPADAATYARWLRLRREQVTAMGSWGVTALIALVAGPWAVMGVFYGSERTIFGILSLVVIAPVAEETMKVAAATYVVERRPFLFVSSGQILICAMAGGLAFAAIENLMYLNVYVPHPEPWLVLWRWTVCVSLHVGCSGIAGLGLVRVWREVWESQSRPRLTRGFPLMLAAVIVHGSYNGLAVLFELLPRIR